jgi:type IV secretion system protein VirB10
MTSAAEPHAQPTVAIRARAPSPRRLSRKVLLASVVVAGMVIAISLMLGLSPQARRTDAQQNATATASGPPESITLAPPGYDVANLQPPHGNPIGEGNATELQPPTDPMWTAGSAHSQGHSGASGAATAMVTAPDPQAAAHAAPILFSADRSQAASGNARDAGEANLNATLSPPRSRFEIQSGSVIPAALLTGLNSDVSGRVIAQVTEPVYDSVTGEHLLVPQGARLIGAYDNGVRYGDRRILLVWNRLILPNGWSINLRQMNASDPSGAAGLAATTNNHFPRLAGAIGLSAIISVIANQSEDDRRPDASSAQNVGEAAAQQAAQTGSQIVQRELSVHPTLSVRPGANVRVLVIQDIQLRPYRALRASS